MVALAALAAASTAAGAAAADGAPGGERKQEVLPTSGYTVTVEDAAGVVLDRRSGTGRPSRFDPGSGGSGCATVDAWRRSSTLFGNTAYVFHQVKHWCWTYPNVTSVSVGTYFSSVDPNYLIGGTWGHGWHFSSAGSATGGHYSFRQARVDNCVFHYGCIRTEYPWVEIWVNSSGGWSYNTGL